MKVFLGHDTMHIGTLVSHPFHGIKDLFGLNFDAFVKSQKAPSPLADFAIVALATTAEMGEGWGEGENMGFQ